MRRELLESRVMLHSDGAIEVAGDSLAASDFSIQKDMSGAEYSANGVSIDTESTVDSAQVLVLDLDGAESVDFRGPVEISGIDIPALRIPPAVTGSADAVADALVARLHQHFPDLQIVLQPPEHGPYSTVFIGGHGAAFSDFGPLWGVAETIDDGNQNRRDNAFVFSEAIPTLADTAEEYGNVLAFYAAHEIGHLLGQSHAHESLSDSPLAEVAFSPYTHAEVGNDVRLDVALDGTVEIAGESYPVHPRIIEALKRFPSAFSAGTVGPDGYPDIIMGQQVVHPESVTIWVSHVLDKAWEAQTDSADGSRYSQSEQLQILAWAYGFASHTVSDVWAHTLVDEITDGPFPGVGQALDVSNDLARGNALRHLIVEAYIADATPGFDGVGSLHGDEEQQREQLPDGDVSANSSVSRELNAPHAFIYDALILDLPDLVAQSEQDLFVIPGSPDSIKQALILRTITPEIVEVFQANGVNGIDGNIGSLTFKETVVEEFVWQVSADYRDFVIRKVGTGGIPADGFQLEVSQQNQSRGLLIDFFLDLRQKLVDLVDAPQTTDHAALDSMADASIARIDAMNNGDPVEFDVLIEGLQDDFDDLYQPADSLIDMIDTTDNDEEMMPIEIMPADILAVVDGFVGRLGGSVSDYLRYWIRNIDEGLQNWAVVGESLSRSMFDPQARRDGSNEEGRSYGPDAVDPDFNDLRADQEDAGLFGTLLSQLNDPNQDGDLADSFINNHLISMLGLPKSVGKLLGKIETSFKQFERDVLDVTNQLPRELNPLGPLKDAVIDKLKDVAYDLITDLIEEKYGVNIQTVDALLSDPSARLDIQSITLGSFETPLFRPQDREIVDRALGFFGTEHLVPISSATQLTTAFGDADNVRLYEDASGPLKPSAEFDKATFAPYANSVTMTKLLLLQEFDPMFDESGVTGDESGVTGDESFRQPKVISQLLSDLTSQPYDFEALNIVGEHGGSLITATMPGVSLFDGSTNLTAAVADIYSSSLDHEVWLTSIDSDHVWRTDSASRGTENYRYLATSTGAIDVTATPDDDRQSPTPGVVTYVFEGLEVDRSYKLQTDWLINNQLHNLGELSPARKAIYTINNGGTIATVEVDQRTIPGDPIDFPLDEIVIPEDVDHDYERSGQGWRQLTEFVAASTTLTITLSSDSGPAGFRDDDGDNIDDDGSFVVAGRMRLVDSLDGTQTGLITNQDVGGTGSRYSESLSVVMDADLVDIPDDTPVTAMRALKTGRELPAAVLQAFRDHGQFFGQEYYAQLGGEVDYLEGLKINSPYARGYLVEKLDDLQWRVIRLVKKTADLNELLSFGEEYHLSLRSLLPTSIQATLEVRQQWLPIDYQTGGGNFTLWESDLLRDNAFRRLFQDWQNGDSYDDYLNRVPNSLPDRDFPELGDLPTEDPNNGRTAPIEFGSFVEFTFEETASIAPQTSQLDPATDLIVDGDTTLTLDGDQSFRYITGNGDATDDNLTLTVNGTLTIGEFAGGRGLTNITINADKIILEDGATISSRQLVILNDHASTNLGVETGPAGTITLAAKSISIGENARVLAHGVSVAPGNVNFNTSNNTNRDNLITNLLDTLVGSGLEYFGTNASIDIDRDAVIRGGNVNLDATTTTEERLTVKAAMAYPSAATELAQLDSDLELELVVATRGEGIIVYQYDPDNNFFASGELIETGGMHFTSLAIADIDGDGNNDIVAGSSNSLDRVYQNVGGSFAAGLDIGSMARATTSVKLVELDGDGRLELVVGTDGEGLIFQEVAGGVAANDQVIDADAARRITDVVVADLDDDGNPEFVVATLGDSNRIYSGNLTDGFTSVALPGTAFDTKAIMAANFDADPELEIAVATDRGAVHFYQNTGGVFADPVVIAAGEFRSQDLVAADLNEDGNLDLVVANDHQQDLMLIGNGAGAFTVRALHPDADPSTAIAVANLDGEAGLDIIVTHDRVPTEYLRYVSVSTAAGSEFLYPVDRLVGVDQSVIGGAEVAATISRTMDAEGRPSDDDIFESDKAVVVSADANSEIVVREGALIDAQGDLIVGANATTIASVETSRAAFGITFGRSRPVAKIEILNAADLRAGGTIDLHSHIVNDLDVVARVPSEGDSTAISVAIAIADAISLVDVRSGANLTAGTLTVSSTGVNDYRNESVAMSAGGDSSSVAGTLATGFNQSTVDAKIGGNIVVENDFTLVAYVTRNENFTRSAGVVGSGGGATEDSSAETSEGVTDSPFYGLLRTAIGLLPYNQQIEDLAAGIEEADEIVSGIDFQFADNPNEDDGEDDVDNAIAAGIALVTSDNDAAASIDTQAIVQVGGSLMVDANAEDVFSIAATANAGSLAPAGKVSFGGAVVSARVANQSSAFIGWDAIVDARETLRVNANSDQISPASALGLTLAAIGLDPNAGVDAVDAAQGDAEEVVGDGVAMGFLDEQLDSALAAFEDETKLGTSFVHSSGATADGGTSLGFAISYVGNHNAAYAGIAAAAQVNQRPMLWEAVGGASPNQDVSVTADATNRSISFGGTPSVLAVLMDESATNVGGVLNVAVSENVAIATIDDRARVDAARDIKVTSTGDHDVTSIVVSGAVADSTAVEGAVGYTRVTSNVLAVVEDRAQLDAGRDVTLDATGATDVINVAPAAALTGDGGTAVGLGATVNEIRDRAEAYIGDRHNDLLGQRPDDETVLSGDGPAGGARSYGGRLLTDIPAGSYIGFRDGGVPLVLPDDQSLLGSVEADRDVIINATTRPNVWSIAIAGAAETGAGGEGEAGSGPSTGGLSGPTQSLSATDGDGMSVSGDSGFGLAASASINVIRETTGAYISDSVVVTAGRDVSMKADAEADLIAVAGALSLSASGTAFGANYARNHFLQNTKSGVERAAISAGSLTTDADSRNRQLVIAPTGTIADGSAFAGGGAVVTPRINTTAYIREQVKLDVGAANIVANNDMTLFPIAGLLAIGGDNAVGANVVRTNVDTFVNAWIDDQSQWSGRSDSANVVVAADNQTKVTAIGAAVGASGGNALAGSGNFVDFDHDVRAFIADGTELTVGNLFLDANDETVLRELTGVLVAAGGSASVGLSITQFAIDRVVSASIGTSSTITTTGNPVAIDNAIAQLPDLSSGRGVIVDATVDDDHVLFAIGGAAGSEVAGGASLIVHRNGTESTPSAVEALIGGVVDSADDVFVNAEHATDIVDAAGGVGVAGTAGIGLTISSLNIHKRTRAEIGSSQVTAAGSVDVLADSGEQILDVIIGFGAGGTAGLAASIAIDRINTETSALIRDSAVVIAGGTIDIEANGDFEAKFISGSVGAGGTAGIGAANATLIHNDIVSATIGNDAEVVGSSINVDATSTEKWISVGIAFGAGGTAGVAGVAVVSLMDETTSAIIGDRATVTATGGSGDIRIHASDTSQAVTIAGSLGIGGSVGAAAGADVATLTKNTIASVGDGANVSSERHIYVTADSNEDITSVAAGAAAAGLLAVALDASVHKLDLTTKAFIADESDGSETIVVAQGSIVIAADDDNEIDKIVGAFAAAGVASIAAGGAVSIINKDIAAFVGEGVSITALGTGETIDAPNGQYEERFEAVDVRFDPDSPGNPEDPEEPDVPLEPVGLEASSKSVLDTKFNIDQLTEGEVIRPDLDTVDTDGTGDDDADLPAQRVIEIRTRENFRGLAVSATQKDDVEVIVITFAVAVGGAVSISAPVNVVDTSVVAWIGDDAIVNADSSGADESQEVMVGAASDFHHLAVAGSLAGGVAGVAPAVTVTHLELETQAFVGEDAEVTAAGDVSVHADSQQDLLLIGIAGAAGIVGVSGAVTSLSIDDTTHAFIDTGAVVGAGGSIAVLANDDSTITSIDGALSAGLVGIGAAVGVISFDKDTQATVGGRPNLDAASSGSGAMLDASGNGDGIEDSITGKSVGGDETFVRSTRHGVIVQADSSEVVKHITLAGSAGLAAVAGAVTVTLIDSDTQASVVDGSMINQGPSDDVSDEQDVFVTAANDASVRTIAAGIAAGLVAAGGAVDVGRFNNDITSRIGDGVQVSAARDVNVRALQNTDIDSFVISAGAGFVGVSGGVSAWSVGSPLARMVDHEGQEVRPLELEDRKADEVALETPDSGSDDVQRRLNSFETPGAETKDNSELVAIVSGSAASSIGMMVPDKTVKLMLLNDDVSARGAEAFIGTDAIVQAGQDIDVLADAKTEVQVRVGVVAAGVAAIGGSIVTLNINANAGANVAGDLMAARDVSVQAKQTDTSDVKVVSGGGGGVAILGARSTTSIGNVTQVNIDPNASIVADTVHLDADHVFDVTSTSDNTAIGGVAGLGALAKRDITGGANVNLGDNVSILADEIRISSFNRVEKQIDSSGFDIDGVSAGGVTGASLTSRTTIGNSASDPLTSKVTIGDGTALTAVGDLIANDDAPEIGVLSIEALNDIVAIDRVRARAGGGVALATTGRSVVDAFTEGAIEIGDAAILNQTGDVDLVAFTDSRVRALSDTYVIAAVNLPTFGFSDASHQMQHRIVAESADIQGRDVNLLAGEDLRGLPGNVAVRAFGNVFSSGLFPGLNLPIVDAAIVQNNVITIGDSSSVKAYEDANVIARRADPASRATAGGNGTFNVGIPVPVPAITSESDSVDANVTITPESHVRAGVNSASIFRVKHKISDDGVTIGSALDNEQKMALGLPTSIEFVFAPLVSEMIAVAVSQATVVRVADDHTGGGTPGEFYQYRPRPLIADNIVLDQEDFSITDRWLLLSDPTGEQTDVAISSNAGLDLAATLQESYYVIKPVDVGDPLVTLANAENLLLAQRRQLLDWIESHSGDPDAVVRYSVQLEEVDRLLADLGVSEVQDDGTVLAPRNLPLVFLQTPKLNASGGSVFIEADNEDAITPLVDSALSAGAGPTIKISNESPFTLVVDDALVSNNRRLEVIDEELVVLESGNVYLNLVSLTSESAPAGEIRITQDTNADGKQVLVDLGLSADLPQDMYIVGSVINEVGDVTIRNSEGSIYVQGEVRAAGTLDIQANGNFQLNSDALAHTGSDPRQYIDFLNEQNELLDPDFEPTTPPKPAPSKELKYTNLSEAKDSVTGASLPDAISDTESSIVANGRITITARFLNVNGLVQSGVQNVDLTVDIGFEPGNRNVNLADEDGNLLPGLSSATEGGRLLIDGHFDAETQTIVIEDIVPQAGSINIAGSIVSTGGGKLVVANGYPEVNIVNQSDFALSVGRIDLTKDRAGTITITDTGTGFRHVYTQTGDNEVTDETFKIVLPDVDPAVVGPRLPSYSLVSTDTIDELTDGPVMFDVAPDNFYIWTFGTKQGVRNVFTREDRSFLGSDGLARDRSGFTFTPGNIEEDPLLISEGITTRSELPARMVPDVSDAKLFATYEQRLAGFLTVKPGVTMVQLSKSQAALQAGEFGWYLYRSTEQQIDLAMTDFTDEALWEALEFTLEGLDHASYVEVIRPDDDPTTVADISLDRETERRGLFRKIFRTTITQDLTRSDLYTFALEASQPIAIDFLNGLSEPKINLQSRGDLILNDELEVPFARGVIELIAVGNIQQAKSTAILGVNPATVFSEGDVFLQLQSTSISTDTPVNVQAGGDVEIVGLLGGSDEMLVVGRITSTGGNVTLRAAGGIMPQDEFSIVRGNRISLTSSQGEIGSDKFDLRIDSDSDVMGGVHASAFDNIFLTETGGDLLLVAPDSATDQPGDGPAISSETGNVVLRTIDGDVLDGQFELFRGSRTPISELGISELDAIDLIGSINPLTFSDPVAPGFFSAILPDADLPGPDLPQVAPERVNISAADVQIYTNDAAGGGSIGQVTAPVVIANPLEFETLKEGDRFLLSEADTEDLVGVSHARFRYLGADRSDENLSDQEFTDTSLWELFEPDFQIRLDTPESPQEVTTGRTVFVQTDRLVYGTYRYTGTTRTMILSDQAFRESDQWERVEADHQSTETVDLATGDLVEHRGLIRSLTVQLIDDIDIDADSVIALASGGVTIASPANLVLRDILGVDNVRLSAGANLIDMLVEKGGVTTGGDLTLEAAVAIRADDASLPLRVNVPRGTLRIEAGAASVVQENNAPTINGTVVPVGDLHVTRAIAAGTLSIGAFGDLTVLRAESDARVNLVATGELIDGYFDPADTIANAHVNSDTDDGRVFLQASGAIGTPDDAFEVQIVGGTLRAISPAAVNLGSLGDLVAESVFAGADGLDLRVRGNLDVQQVGAVGGDVAIDADDSIRDINPGSGADIGSESLELISRNHSIGEPLNDLEIDSASVQLTAAESIYVAETDGPMLVNRANVDVGGHIRLSSLESTDVSDNDSDLRIVGEGLSAAFGSITLLAGDDVSISSPVKTDHLLIHGDFRSNDSRGANVSIGNVDVGLIEIETGDQDDLLSLSSVTTPIVASTHGGNDTIKGGGGNDIYDGGAGVDFIEAAGGDDQVRGGGGVGDQLFGGFGNDLIIGSEDGADLDENFDDDERFGDLLSGGPGDDRINGLGGADLIDGGDGNDVLFGGAGVDRVLGGPGNDAFHKGVDNEDAVDPGAGDNTEISGDFTRHTLPDAPIELSRWAEANGSASELGVNGKGNEFAITVADQPSVLAIRNRQMVAWTDTRSGLSQVYVARHSLLDWKPLGRDSAGGGVSDPDQASWSPDLAADDEGQLLITYLVDLDDVSEVHAQRFNEAEQRWQPFSESTSKITSGGSISNPKIVATSVGPVVGWIEEFEVERQIRVQFFDGAEWKPLGLNRAGEPSDAGRGISLADSGADIDDFQLVTDGDRIAAVWSQTVNQVREIYLLEFDGAVWNEHENSASGRGVSAELNPAIASSTANTSPTVSYHSGSLFVAWQASIDEGAAVATVIYEPSVSQFVPRLLAGLLPTSERSAGPALASGETELKLFYAPRHDAIFAMTFADGEFSEAVAGDASGDGIHSGSSQIRSLVATSAANGKATVSWIDETADAGKLFLRFQRADFSFTNLILPGDVNRNGKVTALDALLVINFIGIRETTELEEPTSTPEMLVDVNGDGFATALDALLIINQVRIEALLASDKFSVDLIENVPMIEQEHESARRETVDQVFDSIGKLF